MRLIDIFVCISLIVFTSDKVVFRSDTSIGIYLYFTTKIWQFKMLMKRGRQYKASVSHNL